MAAIFGEQKVSVVLPGITLTLINDALGALTPIARFEIEDLEMRLSAFSHDRTIVTDLAFAACLPTIETCRSSLGCCLFDGQIFLFQLLQRKVTRKNTSRF